MDVLQYMIRGTKDKNPEKSKIPGVSNIIIVFSIPFFRVDTTPYIPALKCFGIKVMSLGFIYNDRSTIIVDGFISGRMARQTLCDIKWDELDFLLIDLPPGTGEPQKTLINTMAIDGAIIVTTPHEFSFMDSSRGLKLLNDSGIDIFGVIENMSSFICPNCGVSTDLFPQNEKHHN